MTHTTASQKYQVCADAGMSQAETSRHLNVTREAVRVMANRHSINFKDGKETPLTIALKFGELDGLTALNIAARFNVTKEAVYTLAANHGCNLGRSAHPSPVADRVKILAAEGFTATEIAAKIGRHPSSISLIKKRCGIKIRRHRRTVQ